jgi:uncharacterized membrane protein (GlpM family)
MLLIVKAIAAPLLILMLTRIGRRFGPAVSGLLMGIPLITGPVSLFTAVEQGSVYAGHAAVANLVGQVSTCLFCLAYAKAAVRWNPALSALAGICAFLLGTVLWNQISWSLWPATLFLILSVFLLPWLLPVHRLAARTGRIRRFDLPLRMVVSALMVLGLTTLAGMTGPQLSGLISPFPTFVLILAVFTQIEAGGDAAANLARGVVTGSLSFAAFFVSVGVGLERMGLWIYPFAAIASVAVSSAIYAVTHRNNGTQSGLG